MKAIKTFILLFVVVIFIIVQNTTFAQDTLVVYANGPSLDLAIGNDTTATGEQAHKVYKLVSLDTTYLYAGTISVNSNIEINGILGADGRPPTIQPAVLDDGSSPSNFIAMVGEETEGVFKNLYLLGLAPNGAANLDGIAIQISADKVRLTTDNVIFEEWLAFAIGYNGNWDKFFITNCKFRNMVHPNQWYVGEVLRNEWPGAVVTDSIVMRYNTMIGVNGYAAAPVTKFFQTYFDFSHNSVIYTFKNPFFIFNVTEAKINDNIFFGAWSGGMSKQEMPWWDQLWSPEIGSIIDLDTLDMAKDSVFNPSDIGKDNFRMLSEAKRTIEVKNNAYFWPEEVTNLWTAWNDTAHVDSIFTPTWMNTRTTGMFTDKNTWPGLTESGNINVDPGYGASIIDMLTNTSGKNGIGFIEWFKLIRTGATPTEGWGYQLTQVGSEADWVPAWPLPETTDLKYTNEALKTGGTDGLPLGDPYWIIGTATGVEKVSSIPTEYVLQQNYPNPFNPATVIEYSIKATGAVKLDIYNVLGQHITTLVDLEQSAGSYKVDFNASELTSGIYFYTLKVDNVNLTKKMMLLK